MTETERDKILRNIREELPQSDKWNQLRETISEIKENNTYDHADVSEVCGFLLNYMSVLEKEGAEE